MKIFCRGCAVLTVLVLVVSGATKSQAAEDPVLFGRIAAMAAPNTPWDEAWTRFKAHLEPGLGPDGHNIDFQYFIRGEVGNEDEMLRAVRRNRVQIMGASLQGLATMVPELTVAMAPYLFESEDEVDFVYDNYLFEPASQLLAEKGLVLLRWGEVGWTDIYANKKVALPEDVAGLKLRGAPNVSAQVFLRGVGANSVPVGSVDLVPALQRGVVEGGASNLIFHFFSTRQYASHLTLTHHSYDTGGHVANKAWYDTATEAQKAQIIAAFGPVSIDRSAIRNLVGNLLVAMRKEGIEVYQPNEQERAEWVERTKPLVFRITEEVGGESQMIYDAIMAGKEAFRLQQKPVTSVTN